MEESYKKNTKLVVLLFSSVVFLSSCLLFIIQPIFAKYILSWFGGTSSVWIVCLVFYQGVLALGYIYAYLITRCFSIRIQLVFHSILLSMCLFLQQDALTYVSRELLVDVIWLKVLNVLVFSIGLPFFILSSSSPLLQSWMGLGSKFKNIYRMYAISNLGSLLALILYPFFIEPYSSRTYQYKLWLNLFYLYVFLFLLVNFIIFGWVRKGSMFFMEKVSKNISFKDFFLWLSLSALSVSLLVSTTTVISKQILPLPLLWVLPLVVYLLTFVLCFSKGITYSKWFFVFHVLACWLCYYTYENMSYVYKIISSLVLLFSSCMICNSKLYGLRPSIDRLTLYYVWIAIGGFFGSFITTIVSSYFFVNYEEYELSLLLVLLASLFASPISKRSGASKLILLVVYIVLSFIFFKDLLKFNYINTLVYKTIWSVFIAYILYVVFLFFKGSYNTYTLAKNIFLLLVCSSSILLLSNKLNRKRGVNVYNYRNFYGAVKVLFRIDSDGSGARYAIDHSGIIHGSQFINDRRQATKYYRKDTALGKLLTHSYDKNIKVALVGLGVGTLASYAKDRDEYIFYEIDKEIINLSIKENKFFSYVTDARKRGAKIDILEGDARHLLEKQSMIKSQAYDVIVLDAFLSDSIPVHLMTSEAFSLYKYHLNPNGVIAIHMSNKYIDLKPIILLHANKMKMNYSFSTSNIGYYSEWMLLSKDRLLLESLHVKSLNLSSISPVKEFSDEYNSVLGLIKYKF